MLIYHVIPRVSQVFRMDWSYCNGRPEAQRGLGTFVQDTLSGCVRGWSSSIFALPLLRIVFFQPSIETGRDFDRNKKCGCTVNNLEAKSEFKRVCTNFNSILWRLSDPKILQGYGCGLQRQQLRIFRSKSFKDYLGNIAICPGLHLQPQYQQQSAKAHMTKSKQTEDKAQNVTMTT